LKKNRATCTSEYYSGVHIPRQANACREIIKNLRCGCNFGIPQMLIISHVFSENPASPRIFLVFFHGIPLPMASK